MQLDKSVARIGETRTGLLFRVSKYSSLALGSLPIPSREEIMNSPAVEHHGATSGFTQPYHQRPPSPIMDDPGAELDRELAGAHMRR